MFYRVFGGNDACVEPALLLAFLRALGLEITASFRSDDQGWFQAELLLAGADEPVKLERFLAGEDGIRGELNTWAAWLETTADGPLRERLMRHMISTRQVFTFLVMPVEEPDDPIKSLCWSACQYLAGVTAGVYQVDGRGFFDAGGQLLVRDD